MQFRRTFNQRTIALLLACALTFGPLLALNFRSLPRTTENAFERVSYLRLPQAPTTAPEPAKPPSVGKTRRLVGSPRATKTAESTAPPTAVTEYTPTLEVVQPISAAKAEAPERAELPASAPIKLDLATVRAANRASKSDVRNLAENSGTYFGDEPSSKSEQLADAITRTGKEDCIGPNPGGSILSVLVIAYMAAKDKCK